MRQQPGGRGAFAEHAEPAKQTDAAARGEDGGGVGAREHPAVQLLELEARLPERGVVRVQRRRHLDVGQAPASEDDPEDGGDGEDHDGGDGDGGGGQDDGDDVMPMMNTGVVIGVHVIDAQMNG